MTYSFRTNGNFIDFVHTDDTSLLVESVLRSLHNTSRCVTWSLPEDTTRISFVVDDIRVDNFLLSEIDFDGVAIDSQDDFETGIIAAFPGLAGGGSPGSSYLVYNAQILQSGASAPTEIVFGTDTIGFGSWGRTGVGSFRCISTKAYDATKVYIGGIAIAVSNPIVIPVTNFSIVSGYLIISYGDSGGFLALFVDVLDSSFSSVELSALVEAFNFPEVRLYE